MRVEISFHHLRHLRKWKPRGETAQEIKNVAQAGTDLLFARLDSRNGFPYQKHNIHAFLSLHVVRKLTSKQGSLHPGGASSTTDTLDALS